jgi:hypothetical protein
MKRLILTVAIALTGYCSLAQNTNYGTETFSYNDNTVYHYGLGWYFDSDASAYGPMAYLSAFGGIKFFTTGGVKAILNVNGNFGIGTVSPLERLHVAGAIRSTSNAIDFSTSDGMNMDYYPDGIIGRLVAINSAGTAALGLYTGNGSERMRITSGGNILIGKISQTNTAYKLDINGNARANEVVVNTTGADFVFKPTYSLPKLSAVKSYIELNHHLPEIPSAEQMQKDGMSVGGMNTKLLQKVEELTLYAIEQQKQIEQIKHKDAQLQSLQEQIDQLKLVVTKLSKQQ